MMPNWNQMRQPVPRNQQMMVGNPPNNQMMGGYGMDPSFQMGGGPMYQGPMYPYQGPYMPQPPNLNSYSNPQQMGMMMSNQPAPPPNQPPNPPISFALPPSGPTAPAPGGTNHVTTDKQGSKDSQSTAETTPAQKSGGNANQDIASDVNATPPYLVAPNPLPPHSTTPSCGDNSPSTQGQPVSLQSCVGERQSREISCEQNLRDELSEVKTMLKRTLDKLDSHQQQIDEMKSKREGTTQQNVQPSQHNNHATPYGGMNHFQQAAPNMPCGNFRMGNQQPFGPNNNQQPGSTNQQSHLQSSGTAAPVFPINVSFHQQNPTGHQPGGETSEQTTDGNQTVPVQGCAGNGNQQMGNNQLGQINQLRPNQWGVFRTPYNQGNIPNYGEKYGQMYQLGLSGSFPWQTPFNYGQNKHGVLPNNQPMHGDCQQMPIKNELEPSYHQVASSACCRSPDHLVPSGAHGLHGCCCQKQPGHHQKRVTMIEHQQPVVLVSPSGKRKRDSSRSSAVHCILYVGSNHSSESDEEVDRSCESKKIKISVG